MSMKPTAYIAINGIHSDPGASDGWTDRFVTWMHRMNRGCVAEKWEYYTFFALRWLRQGARARAIAALVREYQDAGYRVVMVGHSNGCDLIGRVLAAADIRVDAVHLIAPATDEELFVDALARGAVRRIHTYGSKRDGALRLAGFTKLSVGSVHLGYGSMGLRCREFAAQFPGVVFDHSDDRQDHSTWFNAEATGFQQTMRTILAADQADQQTYGEESA